LGSEGSDGIVYSVDFAANVGVVSSQDNQAVYLDSGAADPVPLLVLRRGDKFDNGGEENDTIVSLSISTSATASGSTGGYGRAINGSGQILLNMGFSASSGVFLISPAVPD
jgi:hypothetical protein